MPYKHNEPRRHKIPNAKYKVSNWREYDQALQQRGSLTVWVTPEALEAWAPEKSGRRGRPTSYSDIVIETAVMLRLAMGKPWRQTEGMLNSIIGMLGLDLPVPDHTTLSRRSARLSLTTTLKKPKGPVNVVIDSSGLKIFGAGEWLHEKHGGKPRRSWRRLHLAVDPDSSEILAAELTTTDEGDASLVGPLLDQIDGPISAMLADGAYDGDPTYQTILDRHPDATVVIPPRSNAVLSDTADTEPTQRDRHIEMLARKGRIGWQKAVGYGKRSLVETAFYRYKVLIGRSLRSVRAEGRGLHRPHGDQPHDQPRHAGLPEGRLNIGTEGDIRPQRHLCTKAADGRCRPLQQPNAIEESHNLPSDMGPMVAPRALLRQHPETQDEPLLIVFYVPNIASPVVNFC